MEKKRRVFVARIGRVNPDRLVFLDEAGANTSMGRSHAWIRKGTELLDPRPMNWGDNLTMIGAVRRTGFVALGTMFQSANRERFERWLERRLLPKLHPGDVLIMDNAQAHKGARVRALCRRFRVRLEYLPPYSPDLNPIEPSWAIIKKQLRRHAPRTRTNLRVRAHQARLAVTARHCAAWFEHAGYRQLK